jgi:Zn ribbon nucleic-acid-binding protein
MSLPFAEDRPLHIQTSATTALWQLRIWADNGVATVECAKCDNGQVLAAGRDDRPFVLADLSARVETHIAVCQAARPS